MNPPKDRKSFIYDVLYPGRHREHTPDGILQVAYNEEQMKKLVRLPIIIDSDPGPAEVWRVAHLNKSCDEFVFSFYQHFKSLRERGYVMWNYERLAKWGLLKIPCQGHPETDVDWDRAWERMRRSQDRRSQIWRNGGHGWWSIKDESKIIYEQPTQKKH